MRYERKISALFYKPLLFVASTFVLSFIYMVYIMHELWEKIAEKILYYPCLSKKARKRQEKWYNVNSFMILYLFFSMIPYLYFSYWARATKNDQRETQNQFMIEIEKERKKRYK